MAKEGRTVCVPEQQRQDIGSTDGTEPPCVGRCLTKFHNCIRTDGGPGDQQRCRVRRVQHPVDRGRSVVTGDGDDGAARGPRAG